MLFLKKYYERQGGKREIESWNWHSLVHSANAHERAGLNPKPRNRNVIQVSHMKWQEFNYMSPSLLPLRVCSNGKLESGARAGHGIQVL